MKKISENLKAKTDLNRQLKEEYHKALKDDAFLLLTSKLKLKEEELMKYTSNLEECSKEYDGCMHCDGLACCNNKITGYAYLPKVQQGTICFQYQACRYQEKMRKQTKHCDNIYYFNVPSSVKNAKMSDVYKDDKKRHPIIKWLSNFIVEYKKNPKQKGLYLYGNFGCGKTYLISAMFNELAKNNVKSAIVFWPEFLRDLKSSFQTDFKEKYEYIKKVPILLIDDIGAENTTPWGRDEIFCPLIQYRMQESLPTFFTSNFDTKSLEEHFANSTAGVEVIKARRIIERIHQISEPCEIISKNLRK